MVSVASLLTGGFVGVLIYLFVCFCSLSKITVAPGSPNVEAALVCVFVSLVVCVLVDFCVCFYVCLFVCLFGCFDFC